MSILVKNCMFFWRETPNIVEVSLQKLTFKMILPLQWEVKLEMHYFYVWLYLKPIRGLENT